MFEAGTTGKGKHGQARGILTFASVARGVERRLSVVLSAPSVDRCTAVWGEQEGEVGVGERNVNETRKCTHH